MSSVVCIICNIELSSMDEAFDHMREYHMKKISGGGLK